MSFPLEEYLRLKQKQLEDEQERHEVGASLLAEYIKRKQEKLEDEQYRYEAAQAAKKEAEARKLEEIAARKRRLLEHQEDERARQKYSQFKERSSEQKWNKQFGTLLAQVKDSLRKNNKLEEIRTIIQNREPSLQTLDWASWLANPLNEKLAELDYDHALEMFKRDNLLVKRRKGTGGRRKSQQVNYALSFTGDTSADSTRDYVSTDFNPDDYNLNLGFTVSYWVRPDAVGTHMFAFGRKYSNTERFTFGIDSSRRIYVGAGPVKMTCTWDTNCDDNSSGQTATQLFPSLFDGGDLKTGNWLHFAVTYVDRESTSEGSVARKVFLNGELIQNANLNWSTTGGSFANDGMYFGARNLRQVGDTAKYNNGWDCALSQVAIFDTRQSEAWVESIYNAGRTGTDHTDESGLVGYWKFNEGSGTTVTDYSGNGNHGTFGAISGDTTAYPSWEKS